jgi:ubiquinone/menaquinone biosynthesis C-methylase UbiE
MPQPNHEQANTNFTEINGQEVARITLLDDLLTAGIGVLPEQSDLACFGRVLDIGCGAGGWLLTGARKYPARSVSRGIDISNRVIQQARARATKEGLAQQVDFQVMGALRPLKFADASFDLVNLRFGMSFVRTWEWIKLLVEMQRVTCTGGIIRLTEDEVLHSTSSAALTHLDQFFLRAYDRAWRLFEPTSTGLTSHLALLLRRIGCQQVQETTFPLVYQAGTEEGQRFVRAIEILLKTARSSLQKWGNEPSGNYDELAQQVLKEIQQPDFITTWTLHTIWGTVVHSS